MGCRPFFVYCCNQIDRPIVNLKRREQKFNYGNGTAKKSQQYLTLLSFFTNANVLPYLKHATALLPFIFATSAERLLAEDSSLLSAIREGYFHNRKHFTDFVCEFELIEGTATSVDNGRIGEIERTGIRHGIWVVSGVNVRYELDCEHERTKVDFKSAMDNAEKTGELASEVFSVHVDCIPIAVLSDGGITLTYNWAVHNATIRHTAGPRAILDTPWTAGMMGEDESRDLVASIDQKIPGDTFCRLVSIAEDAAYDFVFENGQVDGGVRTYTKRWKIDSTRGFLPIKIEFSDGPEGPEKPDIVSEAVNIQRFPNGGFFPMTQVVVSGLCSEPPFKVRMYRVIRLDLTRPQHEDFRIAFSSRTKISNPSDMRSVFVDDQLRSVNLADLPTLLQRCQTTLEGRRIPVHEKTASHTEIYAILGVIIVSVIFFALYRRRSRAH